MALYTIRAQADPDEILIDAGVAPSIKEGQAHGRRAVRERMPRGCGLYFVFDNRGREVARGERTLEKPGVHVWKETIV